MVLAVVVDVAVAVAMRAMAGTRPVMVAVSVKPLSAFLYFFVECESLLLNVDVVVQQSLLRLRRVRAAAMEVSSAR